MDLSQLRNTPPWEWPVDAGPRLRAAIEDRSAAAAERVTAIELASDPTIMDDAMAATLLRVVAGDHEDAELRGRAAIALGPALELMDEWEPSDLDEPLLSRAVVAGIKQTFRQLYADAGVPRDVRRRVLEAAVRAPEDWQHGATRAAWLGGDPAWRLTAIFCMRFLPGFGARIVEALDSDDVELRYEAVCAAENWTLQDAWTRVVRLALADDEDRDVRLAAIAAVAAIRPSAARDVLAELTVSRDEEIADAAFEAVTLAEGEGALDD